MKAAGRLPLTVFAALLAAWLVYLGWLAFTRPLQAPGYPLVVSRPQVLVSELDVIGEVEEVAPEGKPTKVKVVEVLSAAEGVVVKAGDVLEVDGLPECRPVKRGQEVPDDCPGPGKYLMPLRRSAAPPGRYEVCPVPASPGFRPSPFEPVRRVYRADAETRAQYARITKP